VKVHMYDQDLDRLMLFRSRYGGNPSDHIQQSDDGNYTRMGRAITNDDLRRHFQGLVTLGVYPVRPVSNDCRFLVFDIDDGKPATLTALLAALDEHGIGEDSRTVHYSGRKGWHVTVLFTDWLPAAIVRRAGKAILDSAGNPKRVELFPKQDAVDDGKQGNGVKLPEGWHREAKVWANYERGSRTWQTVNRLDRESIERIAGEVPTSDYPTPTPAPALVAGARSYGSGRAFPGSLGQRAILPPCMRKALEQGVPDGMRNRALFSLALTLYSKGVPESTALRMVREASERCLPPETAEMVRHHVSTAYSGRYRGLNCASEVLHDDEVTLCQSSCRVYRAEFGRAA
jgi:hypothetical protein